MKLLKSIILIGCVFGMLFISSQIHAAKLKAQKEFLVAKYGDGQWELKILLRPDGSAYGMPSGETVDNHGNIYLCDTFRNRILVFTAEGKPWKIIKHRDLYHPLNISVSEDNTIFVDSVIRGKGEDIQYIISYDGSKWNFRSLEKVEPFLTKTKDQESDYHAKALPSTQHGLRYIISPDTTDKPIRLFDKNNKYVKSVPSVNFDKKGRYYTYSMERKKRVIVDEDGNILGEFNSEGTRKLKYRGWIYFIEKGNGKWTLLRRYGEDGTVEHEIKADGELLGTGGLLISPNNKFVFLKTGRSAKKIWITRLTYQEN